VRLFKPEGISVKVLNQRFKVRFLNALNTDLQAVLLPQWLPAKHRSKVLAPRSEHQWGSCDALICVLEGELHIIKRLEVDVAVQVWHDAQILPIDLVLGWLDNASEIRTVKVEFHNREQPSHPLSYYRLLLLNLLGGQVLEWLILVMCLQVSHKLLLYLAPDAQLHLLKQLRCCQQIEANTKLLQILCFDTSDWSACPIRVAKFNKQHHSLVTDFIWNENRASLGSLVDLPNKLGQILSEGLCGHDLVHRQSVELVNEVLSQHFAFYYMLDLSIKDPLKQKRFRDVKILAVTLEHQVVQFLVVNKQGKVRL